MPPPLEVPSGYRPNYDHYLDDVLVVMENSCEGLRACMQLVSQVMVAKGYLVSNKSVLSPTTYVKWLSKEVDLDVLSISNTISVLT